MAKFGSPLLVNQISGSIGGVVFTGSRSSPTIRVRVKPANPSTSKQSVVRANLVAAARAYKGLSTTNAQAWRDYGNGIAKPNGVGGTFAPSGINAYVELAAVYLAVNGGGTPPTTPPASPFTGDTITITGAGTTGAVTFTASAANTSGITTEILIAKLSSVNRLPKPSDYRIQEYHAFVSGTLTRTISKPVGAYGLAYRFVDTTTGQRSAIVALGTFSAS